MPAYNEIDLPQPPHLRTWRETVEELMHDYPEEFTSGGEESLKQQLQEIDVRIKIAENYLDHQTPQAHLSTDEDLEAYMIEARRGYRDRKRWLDED